MYCTLFNICTACTACDVHVRAAGVVHMAGMLEVDLEKALQAIVVQVSTVCWYCRHGSC